MGVSELLKETAAGVHGVKELHIKKSQKIIKNISGSLQFCYYMSITINDTVECIHYTLPLNESTKMVLLCFLCNFIRTTEYFQLSTV